MSFIIKKPLVTEKNTRSSASGVYVFEVQKNSSKTEIKNEFQKAFGVKVDSVRTVICRGRVKRQKAGAAAAPSWKKAIVKLRAGEKISLFEGA